MSVSTLCTLPSEIIWNIVSLLSPLDLSHMRMVCKQILYYCDHPSNWRNIHLLQPFTLTRESISRLPSSFDIQEIYSNVNSKCLYLWNLPELKTILEPHLLIIQKIEIWGVRDNIIRYLILNCPNLQELKISGWNTLSDHALRVPAQQLCLRKLKLVGQTKSNFTSVDANTFGNFIARCPLLEELSIVRCQIHIQADSLIDSFDSQTPSQEQHTQAPSSPSSLRSLTVGTKRTWSGQHVKRLFQVCSKLCFLALVPDFKCMVEERQVDNSTRRSKPIMDDNEPALEKSVLSIDDEEMQNSKNIVFYSN
ncbi:unnamed protein product [Mucor hiemalis]